MLPPIDQSGLKRFQKEKRESTIQKVNDAITRLETEGKEVNFKSVAAESFITRKTLYKIPELRERIESLRPQPANKSEYYLESLKRRVSELEKENNELKDKVKYLSNIKYNIVKLKEFIANNIQDKIA